MNRIFTMLLAMTFFFLCGAPIVLLLWSCSPPPPPVCESLSTRCDKTLVEVCDPQGQWSVTADCSQVSPGSWYCGWDQQANTHTCLKEDK